MFGKGVGDGVEAELRLGVQKRGRGRIGGRSRHGGDRVHIGVKLAERFGGQCPVSLTVSQIFAPSGRAIFAQVEAPRRVIAVARASRSNEGPGKKRRREGAKISESGHQGATDVQRPPRPARVVACTGETRKPGVRSARTRAAAPRAGRPHPSLCSPLGLAKDGAVQPGHPTLEAFRHVPKTGVIYVMTEAARHGYRAEDPAWANMGQGQPETCALPGAPPRVTQVTIDVDDHEYAPVAGLWEVREAVAKLYNAQYRVGKTSQYGPQNVAICGGGRLALTRVAAALGQVNLGHFLPDYTAYEELLDIFRTFNPIPISLEPASNYAFDAEALRREVLGRGMGAVLLSNPGNPTGKLIAGKELAGWVDVARELDCSLIFDEFYSNYIWVRPRGHANSHEGSHPGGPPMVSAAAYVQDVDRDPILLVNGLTKNWRYPGWRISWVVGPTEVIEAVTSAGSFLDGGASRPLQRAALPLLEPDYVARETAAVQRHFSEKRTLLLDGLRELGIEVDCAPNGAFYIWADVSNLPAPLNDGTAFFHRALLHKVICVPGEFFDVNPGKRRSNRTARYRSHVRFSFGPSADHLRRGLAGLRAMLDAAS